MLLSVGMTNSLSHVRTNIYLRICRKCSNSEQSILHIATYAGCASTWKHTDIFILTAVIIQRCIKTRRMVTASTSLRMHTEILAKTCCKYFLNAIMSANYSTAMLFIKMRHRTQNFHHSLISYICLYT